MKQKLLCNKGQNAGEFVKTVSSFEVSPTLKQWFSINLEWAKWPNPFTITTFEFRDTVKLFLLSVIDPDVKRAKTKAEIKNKQIARNYRRTSLTFKFVIDWFLFFLLFFPLFLIFFFVFLFVLHSRKEARQ